MKKRSTLLAAALTLTAMLWIFTGCGSDAGDGDGADTGAPYTNSEVTSELSMADDVKAFYDAVDLEYGYQLTHDLAYKENLTDCALGWRSAGSDAEHKTANYLKKKMKKIGLKKVKKVGVPCDKFQFNGSKLTIAGTDIDIMPASYQCNGTGKKGIKAEMVDVGTGLEADYEGLDVKGKIVLADVDQRDVSWIDGYIRQAKAKGAAALVTYATNGYGQANQDTANVQDICCADLIPTCAISVNQAAEIKEALEAGNNKAHLMLDAVLGDNDGTTYNVTGMIPGKNHKQKIIVAGHYDKYWYGFQDDCAAIGLVFTVAKAMVDSGYKPENDIIFIAHGGEEWGVTGSQFDWTVGAWGMIEKNKGWQDSTLALINCELPAFKVEGNQIAIGTVPEFRTLAKKLVSETGLVVTEGDVALSTEPFDTTTMEDGVSYRWHGVPYFINSFEDETFIYNNYHTAADDESTYDEATFHTNINWYGAMAMYIDNEPALELDMTQTAADLEANMDTALAEEAGVDTTAYQAAVDAVKAAATSRNAAIDTINTGYEAAVAAGDKKAAAKLRKAGAKLNKDSLDAFGDIQDDFLKDNDFDIYYGHKGVNDNANLLAGVVEGLKEQTLWAEDEESGALDNAWQINAMHDYNFCIFGKAIAKQVNHLYSPGYVTKNDYWGWKKQIPVVNVGAMTYKLNQVSEEENPDVNWDKAAKVYNKARKKCLKQIKRYSNKEIRDMTDLAESLADLD